MARGIRSVERSEHSEQATVIDWCNRNLYAYPELDLIYAIPNQGVGSSNPEVRRIGFIHQRKMIAEGLKKGMPDLCLPVGRGGYFGLYIEMKRKSGAASKEQKKIMPALIENNYNVVLCKSSESAINVIKAYLQNPRTKVRYD